MTAKFGSVEAIDESHRQLTERGREEGIDYRFDRITRSPNTVDAHRLVRWAAAEGAQDDMVERLFAAYFSEGLDVGDPAVLADLPADVGLEPRPWPGGLPATRTARWSSRRSRMPTASASRACPASSSTGGWR